MSVVTHDHHESPRRGGRLVKLSDPVRSRPRDPTAHLLRAELG